VENKLCQQCVKDCKQFKNVTIYKCKFVSNQKRGGTLQAQDNEVSRGKEGLLGSNNEKT